MAREIVINTNCSIYCSRKMILLHEKWTIYRLNRKAIILDALVCRAQCICLPLSLFYYSTDIFNYFLFMIPKINEVIIIICKLICLKMKGLLLKLLRTEANLKLYHCPVTFLEGSSSASQFSAGRKADYTL